MTTEYLKAPSSLYGLRGGTLVRRTPLTYVPSSVAEVNEARLPLPEDLRGMELAHREQFYSDRQLSVIAMAKLIGIYWGSWLLGLAAVLFGPFMPNSWAVGLAASFAFILVGAVVIKKTQATPLRLMAVFLVPLITVGLLKAIGYLIMLRTLSTILFAVLTLALYFLLGFKPFAFYREWLYTHPRLKPATRANPRPVPLRPSLWVLLALLVIVTFVPLLSPTVALIAVIVFCVLVTWQDLHPLRYLWSLFTVLRHLPEYGRWVMSVYLTAIRGGSLSGDVARNFYSRRTGPTFRSGLITERTSEAFRHLQRPLGLTSILRRIQLVFGQYLTYGLASTEAPGVWLPPQTLGSRAWTVWFLVAPLFITLSVGLHVFCPWDLFSSQAASHFENYDPGLLRETPYEWVYLVLAGLRYGRVQYLLLPALSLAFAVIVPGLVLAAVYRKPLLAAERLRDEIEGSSTAGDPPRQLLDDDGRTEWQWYVDRVRHSQHTAWDPVGRPIREADHLFLGAEPRAQFPVLLHKAVLSEHCYIVGDTGSGKTALGIMPLLLQLIRGFAVSTAAADEPAVENPPQSKHDTVPAAAADADAPDGQAESSRASFKSDGFTEMPPMLILDLKGDNALFQTVKAEVEARRRAVGITDPADPRYAFRFFTPEKGQDSHYFNPFESFRSEARTDIQLCHVFLDALSLNHGEGYGRSYYSRRNRALLSQALKRDPQSISELATLLADAARKSRSKAPALAGEDAPDFGLNHIQDTFELISTINALASYPKLATDTRDVRPEQVIHMPTLIEHRQVAYFWLPAIQESISVREIGKLALYCLLTAAIDRQRLRRQRPAEGEEQPRQVYAAIDEFQRLVGENFKIVLEQARSFGVSAILANQSQVDLNTHDIDLRPTVRTNTRTKMYFALSDATDVAALSEGSGEELAMPETWSYTSGGAGAGTTFGYAQATKPRLTTNDIYAVTDQPTEFILHVSRGAGYTQFAGLPIMVRTTYPIAKELYDQRSSEPWPEPTDASPPPAELSPQEIEDDANQRALAALLADVEPQVQRADSRGPRRPTD